MIASTDLEAVVGNDGFYLADIAGKKKAWMGIPILAGNVFASNGTTPTVCSSKAKGCFWGLYFRFIAPDFSPGVKICLLICRWEPAILEQISKYDFFILIWSFAPIGGDALSQSTCVVNLLSYNTSPIKICAMYGPRISYLAEPTHSYRLTTWTLRAGTGPLRVHYGLPAAHSSARPLKPVWHHLFVDVISIWFYQRL